MEHIKQIDENKQLKAYVVRLQNKVKEQRQLISDMKLEKLQYLKNQNTQLR